jgi:hypothetical protein
VAGRSLNAGTSERSLPNPTPTLRPPTRHVTGVTQRERRSIRTRRLTQTGFVRGRLWRAGSGSGSGSSRRSRRVGSSFSAVRGGSEGCDHSLVMRDSERGPRTITRAAAWSPRPKPVEVRAVWAAASRKDHRFPNLAVPLSGRNRPTPSASDVRFARQKSPRAGNLARVEPRRPSQRRNAMKRIACVVALVVAATACSSSHDSATGTPSTTPKTTAHRYSAADVVRIETAAYPEGPDRTESRSDRGSAHIFSLLPATLPDVLSQGPTPSCGVGNITTLVLNVGTAIRYGPCARPASIDRLRCAMTGAIWPCP